jgi:hypothetical protein
MISLVKTLSPFVRAEKLRGKVTDVGRLFLKQSNHELVHHLLDLRVFTKVFVVLSQKVSLLICIRRNARISNCLKNVRTSPQLTRSNYICVIRMI